MPFLRVIRDKRGYETTYLMHWYREGNRQRSRVLYVFRTPGGVRVGRAPLEPAVLRDIESRHPGIDFDWKAVIDNQQVVESAAEIRRPRKRRSAEDERAATPGAAAPAPPASREEPRAATPSRQPIPSALEGTTPDAQMAFLTVWYPIVRARIPQRTTDPIRQEALLALAERLNPATWSDADQIAAGLLQATDSLERLSRVFARRRRRSRRTSSRPGDPQSSQTASAPADSSPDTADATADPSSSDV